VTDAKQGFVTVLTALWPVRGAGARPPLADWLACRDINELWAAAKSGAVTPEATEP